MSRGTDGRRCAGRFLTSVSFLLALADCGGTGPGPVAPTVSALEYTPTMIQAHQPASITGTYRFHDDNGDFASAHLAVTAPGQDRVEEQPRPIPGGPTDGVGRFSINLVDPVPGTYTFEVWVSDQAGHVSTGLSGTAVSQ